MAEHRTESEHCDHIFLPEERVAVAKQLLDAIAACYARGMSTEDIARVVQAADVESSAKAQKEA